jgi:hypothetical protein
VWWACQDLNLGPHPYQQNAGNRCAKRRSRRSRSTVGPEVMCSHRVQLNGLLDVLQASLIPHLAPLVRSNPTPTASRRPVGPPAPILQPRLMIGLVVPGGGGKRAGRRVSGKRLHRSGLYWGEVRPLQACRPGVGRRTSSNIRTRLRVPLVGLLEAPAHRGDARQSQLFGGGVSLVEEALRLHEIARSGPFEQRTRACDA